MICQLSFNICNMLRAFLDVSNQQIVGCQSHSGCNCARGRQLPGPGGPKKQKTNTRTRFVFTKYSYS